MKNIYTYVYIYISHLKHQFTEFDVVGYMYGKLKQHVITKVRRTTWYASFEKLDLEPKSPNEKYIGINSYYNQIGQQSACNIL